MPDEVTRITVMAGHDGRPLVAFTSHERARQWLTHGSNIAKVQSVLVLTEGDLVADAHTILPSDYLIILPPRTQDGHGQGRLAEGINQVLMQTPPDLFESIREILERWQVLSLDRRAVLIAKMLEVARQWRP